jgi:hypothetical protein
MWFYTAAGAAKHFSVRKFFAVGWISQAAPGGEPPHLPDADGSGHRADGAIVCESGSDLSQLDGSGRYGRRIFLYRELRKL